MKTIKVTWNGITPLIMHSCRCVNPLHPLTTLIKKYTGKRTKTEDDYKTISDLEWLSGLYYNEDISSPDPTYLRDDMYLFVPAENIEATIINGAKAFKKGTDVKKFVTIPELYVPLDIGENKTIAQLWRDYHYRDVRQMVVQKNRVTRTRPRFDRWQLVFELVYDDTKIDLQTIINALEYSGQYVGLCDSRPKYGKFVTVIEEMD